MRALVGLESSQGGNCHKQETPDPPLGMKGPCGSGLAEKERGWGGRTVLGVGAGQCRQTRPILEWRCRIFNFSLCFALVSTH